MVFTKVVYAEDTYTFEEKINEVISNESKTDVTLKDIKFNSVFQGGALGSDTIANTAILIFEKE
ncbi:MULTISPECIES: hypothetical protein [unclassified Oceanobacillus]|uniref:hypothetical protein n=1 Tax=unclassified Oceanobacillus TaxID=2630292 RepID=UPI0012EC418A|nr:hypothetical protein [Oceanobacillus sp. AG]